MPIRIPPEKAKHINPNILGYSRFSKLKRKLKKTDCFKGSIAVVGNGPIESKGEEIDEHDCIIRFHDAPVMGYEKHVGEREGIRFSNISVLLRHVYPKKFFGQSTIYNPKIYDGKIDWRLIGIRHPTMGMKVLVRLWMSRIKCDLYGFTFGTETYFKWEDRLFYKLTGQPYNAVTKHGYEQEKRFIEYINFFRMVQ